MQIPRDAMLLRAFVGEAAHHEGHPLHEAIVLKAREAGLAGATVLRGPLGYGQSHQLHAAKILRLAHDLPVVVEIVDSEQNITRFLPLLGKMVGSGLVTLEKVQVLRYGNTRTDGVDA